MSFTQTEGQELILASVSIINNQASDPIDVTNLTITPENCQSITIENIGVIMAGETSYANIYISDTGVMETTDYTIDDITYSGVPVIVSFETNAVPNGEYAETVEPETVMAGGYASVPTEPTNEGYHLENWYDSYDSTNGYGNVFDFQNTTIETDITLYAKWEANV